MQLIVLEPAIAEVQSICIWYNQKQGNLGDNFVEEYFQALRTIELYPFSCPLKHSKLRVKLLRKFPYAIYYSIDKQKREVYIIGVLHQKRNLKS